MMHDLGRYAESVFHADDEALDFLATYFGRKSVLLIGGAGFDPRAKVVAATLTEAGASLSAVLFREVRPRDGAKLKSIAEENLAEIARLIPDLNVLEIQIFETDGAVVGGRRAVRALSSVNMDGFTDIVVDLSALSIGTSFPLVRWLVERSVAGSTANLHVTVAHSPAIDSSIRPTAGDRAGWIHGFSGRLGVDRDQPAARLWMPQLASESQQELSRIFEFVQPDDTCPILPFPSRDPRLADRLAVAFQQELLGSWDVDVRNIVYADEGDPLDVYRTILRIEDLRRPVFEGSGGSEVIVSPTGSKVTALGALMACLERDLPAAYLEAESYEMTGLPDKLQVEPSLVHVWLEGEVYPQERSALCRVSEES